jgi:hypothetical protein
MRARKDTTMSEFESIVCGECGIEFHVPAHWKRSKIEQHGSFSCPNGHGRKFNGETKAEKLQRELDRAKQNAAYLEDRIRAAKQDAERIEYRRRALAGQVTKLKKRSAGGVCPCCNRTFAGLARHMAQKHPGFVCEPLADNVIELGKTGYPTPSPEITDERE